jgi:putative endonuclease
LHTGSHFFKAQSSDWAFFIGQIKVPYWVYILQNDATSKLYKGQTSDLERRIKRHNAHEIGSKRYTHKQKGTWHLIYSEGHHTRSVAMKREKS